MKIIGQLTNEEAIHIMNVIIYMLEPQYDKERVEEAVEMSKKALELIGHLKNRPCSACEYHKENGCCKWNCVFEK